MIAGQPSGCQDVDRFGFYVRLRFLWHWSHRFSAVILYLIIILEENSAPSYKEDRGSRVIWSVCTYLPDSPLLAHHLSKSSKSLGDEKKLPINILCPKPSTWQVKCLTVVCVALMSSVAECESLPKYTLMSYVYPDSSQSL